MPIRGELIWLAAALASLTIAAGDAPPADKAPPAAGADTIALVRDGRFADAYGRVIEGQATPDPQALAALARAVLVRAIESNDAFERWAGMREARAIGDPAFAAPARTQLHSGGRYEEALALEILVGSDPHGSRNEFVAALDSPYRTIRMRALRALAPEADSALVPRLMVLAGEDGDPDMRVLAIRTLRQWQATDAAPTLRHAVDDPIPAVQQEAVKALVALNDGETIAIIRRKLADAPFEQRAATLRLAALVPRRELLADVGPFLTDSDPDIRTAAARMVLAIGAGAGG